MNATATAVTERFEQGFALHRQGRGAEAMASYEAALSIDPDHAPTLHYSAMLLHAAARSAEAIARLERALTIDGSVPDAWCNAGIVYGSVGRHDDAVRALERSIELEPTLAEAWLNLSTQCLTMEDPASAERTARQAWVLSGKPAAAYNVALALAAQGRRSEALVVLDQADAAGPDARNIAGIPGLRAQLLIATGRLQDARLVLDRALERVDDPFLRIERARLAETLGDLGRSASDFEALLRHGFGTEATYDTALSELTFQKKRIAAWDGLAVLQATFRQRVIQQSGAGDASSLTPFSFLSDPSTRVEQRAAAEAYSRRYPAWPPPARKRATGRVRIGYLSADLHDHATGILAVGLFEEHDRERFEVFAYSTGPDDGSELRRRLVAAFEHFVDANGWPERRIAARIAEDGIDILVDLKGHTERAPTTTMALRPAPIAVSYLGYPGTMGAGFVDYLIGDPIVTPLAHAQDYSETIVQLPHSYQVNDDRRVVGHPPTRAELGLPEEAVVLCAFNSIHKINADVVGAWAAILQRAPDAVLWMQTRGDDDAVRARLARELTARGAPIERVVFARSLPHAQYLALLRRADLFLDTWPYNAHTTASDALWAGCPVLTVIGQTFAGRVAASLLTAVGMPDCIVPDRASYIATAIALANDRERLRALRSRLANSVAGSALFDTRGTARALEAAYVAMIRQLEEGRRGPILVNRDFSVAS